MLIDISRFVPLLGVAFYFNAYPYHYAFVMPPAVAASAPAIRILAQRYGHILLLCLLLANASVLSAAEDRSVLASQRTVLAGVHAIFPQPVTYIDESGMIGSFPRAVSYFASGWGLANYQTKGEPEYRHAADAEPIPLLLVNGGALAGVFDGHASATGGLLPADIQFLRENYIPHWGQLYVAGKQITASNRATDVEIVIPGHYTVEISPITIDGHRHAVGDMVSLARGIHVVAGPRQSDSVLRWGNHLPRPNFPWPQARLFTDF